MSAVTMRAAREFAGLSQSELGRRMSDLGFGWSQMTVSRREDNENTLRWHEGIALRQIIGYPEVEGESVSDEITQADARAYRRILAVIGDREAKDLELERVLAPHVAFADKLMKLGTDGSLRIDGDLVKTGSGTFS